MGGETLDLLKWWAERVDRDFDEETVDRLAAGEEAAIREVAEELAEESIVRIETGDEADDEPVAYTIDLSECLPRNAGEGPAEADGGSQSPPVDRSDDRRDR